MYKILVVLIASALLACDSGGDSVSRAEISGYDFKHLVDKPGDKPNVGQVAYFQMDIYDNKDSLLQTYRNQDILPSVKILDPTDANRKVNPVVDVLSYMSVGDSVALIVPIDSVPNMPPGYEDVDHIEYHLTLAEIISEEEHQARIQAQRELQEAMAAASRLKIPEVSRLTEQTLKDYKAGNLDLQETQNGVKYFIHERGDGDLPTRDRMLTMSYFGRVVESGEEFDNSYKRGRGYSFRVGNDAVIGGWHEIAPYLPVGTRASVFIPSELGYGPQGSPPVIPPDAELYFYLVVDEMKY